MSRANHILAKFPWFYQNDGDQPSNLQQLIKPFGEMMDQAEEDLLHVMASHFVQKADNDGAGSTEVAKQGDLDRMFSLYLQSLGGTSLLKQHNRQGSIDDQEYRARTLGLIKGLMGGASTIEGIRQIVAANLGLAEENPTMERIEIEEFFPEFVRHPHFTLAANERFELLNENDIPTKPEFRIQVNAGFFADLKDIGLRCEDTGDFIQFYGVFPRKSTLVIQTDGQAYLNGTPLTYQGKLDRLPPGTSTWKFMAQLAPLVSRFNENAFNTSIFSEAEPRKPGSFDFTEFDKAYFLEDDPKPAGVFGITEFGRSVFQYGLRSVFLTYGYVKLQPAAFTVLIPWDITKNDGTLREPSGEVRNRIGYIVNKVKGAGVVAEVTYKKEFVEVHQLAARYRATLQLKENQQLAAQPLRLEASKEQPVLHQEMQDDLLLGGVFDHTTFDSLNTFY